jgi:hypothetical protein
VHLVDFIIRMFGRALCHHIQDQEVQNYPEDRGSTFLRNIDYYLPADTAFHLEKLGPSLTPL